MGNPFVKVTLEGTKLTVHPTGATARARYRVEMNGFGDNPDDPTQKIELIQRALRTGKLPQMGSRQGFKKQPGPPIDKYRVLVHDMRLSSYDTGEVVSPNKFYIDCIYESRPAPTIERGTSASQKQTFTYLAGIASGGNANFVRKQMFLDWLAPRGSFTQGQLNTDGTPVAADPPRPTMMPRTPASGSRMEFGDSFRIGSTWYYDEITQTQIDRIKWNYSTCVNSLPLFYISIPQVDDSQLWMCTAINAVTNDGGYSTRISGEFVFSELGWDTIDVYNLPYSDEPAFISDDALKGLYQRLPLTNIGVPSPFIPPGGGVGRWPQNFAVDLTLLVAFLSQGALGKTTTPTVDQLL